jgi:hypothetical protein
MAMKSSNYVATFLKLVATFSWVVKTNNQDFRETLGTTIGQIGFDKKRDCLRLYAIFTNNI